MGRVSADLGSTHSDGTELSGELEELKESSIFISQTSFNKGDRIKTKNKKRSMKEGFTTYAL